MYDGDWGCKADVCKEFKIDDLDGIVIYAGYEYADYSGDAAVIYASDGKLWMVSGSHCSCNGLEDQWSPDEVTIDMLKVMAENGYGYDKKAAQYVVDKSKEFGGVTDTEAFASALMLVG